MALKSDTPAARFKRIFVDYGLIVGFARRRGSRDPESLAAETMSIAWDHIEQLDANDCRPWLLATARNLLLAEYRDARSEPVEPASLDIIDRSIPDFEVNSLEPRFDRALASLHPKDREVLLLIAWDELSHKEAAASLSISVSAFRVRLHRARKRVAALLEMPEITPNHPAHLREDQT